MTEPHWQHRWRSAPLDWSPAYRVIPTRFPAVNLFDRVASPEDFDALYALEAMTNDRLRTEVGELDLVPRRPSLKRFFERLTVQLDDHFRARRTEMLAPNGDRIVTT